MGQDVEALRHDIERSRSDLGDTLDAIGDRVSPGRMIARRRNRISGAVHSVRERVMGTASNAGDRVSGAASTLTDELGPDAVRQRTEGSPIGAGGLAFGIGFLLAATLPKTEAEASVAETVKAKAQPVVGELADAGRAVADDLKGQAADAAEQLKSTASEAAGQVTETAKDQAHAVKDDVDDARHGSNGAAG